MAGFQQADAEDFGQIVFLAVHDGIGRFHRDRTNGSFRGWLRTITNNKIRDEIRKQQIRVAQNPTGGTSANQRLQQLPESSEHSESTENRTLCSGALQLLSNDFSPRDLKTFEEVIVRGRSRRDVAEDLDVKPNVVYLAISRIRKRLREEFEELGLG